MDKVTSSVSNYVQERGISVLRIAEKTEIPYGAICKSLCQKPVRKLRADELMMVCAFLEVDPRRFWNRSPITTHDST